MTEKFFFKVFKNFLVFWENILKIFFSASAKYKLIIYQVTKDCMKSLDVLTFASTFSSIHFLNSSLPSTTPPSPLLLPAIFSYIFASNFNMGHTNVNSRSSKHWTSRSFGVRSSPCAGGNMSTSETRAFAKWARNHSGDFMRVHCCMQRKKSG